MAAIKIPIWAFLRLRAAVRLVVTETSIGFRVIRYDGSAPGDGLFPRIDQRILNLHERRVLVSSGKPLICGGCKSMLL